MNLTKIKDVSDKYGITAKILRYYEDKGLIKSIKSDLLRTTARNDV